MFADINEMKDGALFDDGPARMVIQVYERIQSPGFGPVTISPQRGWLLMWPA
jgi:hypothetical protein